MFDRFTSVPIFRDILVRTAALAGLAAACLAATATAGSAQTPCLARDKMVDLLGGRYSEQPIAMGLESSGRLFEVFATDDGSTWTMVITTPDGASCVVAAGLEWQAPDGEQPDPET